MLVKIGPANTHGTRAHTHRELILSQFVFFFSDRLDAAQFLQVGLVGQGGFGRATPLGIALRARARAGQGLAGT